MTSYLSCNSYNGNKTIKVERLSVCLDSITILSEERACQIPRRICYIVIPDRIKYCYLRFCLLYKPMIVIFHCSVGKMIIRDSIIPNGLIARYKIRMMKNHNSIVIGNNHCVFAYYLNNLCCLRPYRHCHKYSR